MKNAQTNMQIWGAPILMGLLSTVGLAAALLAGGAWDVIAWITLLIPVGVCCWRLQQLFQRAGKGNSRQPAPGSGIDTDK